MNLERFETAVKKHIAKIDFLLLAKAKEYASNEDRLHNFNKAAGITGECREKALFGFALKHLVSVMDMIDAHNKTGILPTQATLDEKFGDLGAYIAILYASFQDKMDTLNEQPR